MLDLEPLVEERNLGLRASDTSKKKMPFCPEQAEQAITGEDVLVGGEMAVVRLAAYIAPGPEREQS